MKRVGGAAVTAFRVVSGNPWFPKWAGRLNAGMRVYAECPRFHDWGGVQVEYLPMLYYPFGKLDAVFNRAGEPLLLLGWLSLKPRLMRIVREFQPDVVYAHHTVPNGYFAMRLKEETGVPFVVTDHEMGEITACERFPARKAVYDKVTRSAFRMVSVAGVMRRDVERVFPQARCETIYNGIGEVRGDRGRRPEVGDQRAEAGDEKTEVGGRSRSEAEIAGGKTEAGDRRPEGGATESSGESVSRSFGGSAGRSAGGSKQQHGAEGRVVVFSCGMFYGRKNFPGLIQAFNVVAEKYAHVVLRIAGDGPDRQEVEAERERSPLKDRIELMGKIGHQEVLRQMRDADIFALIGWREPFATVFLEAMAARLPVIACDDGGIAEVINGAEIRGDEMTKVKPWNTRANGVLVPPMDIPAAARALEFLVVNPEARRQIGAEAQRKVEAELTWDAVIGKYVQVFREAVEQRSCGDE